MTVLTVKEALARIPDREFEEAVTDMLTDLGVDFTEDSDEFKMAKKHLQWIVGTALQALVTITIEADKEEEDDQE